MKKIFIVFIMLLLISCIPTIPTEKTISYDYYVLMLGSDGTLIRDFYANEFSIYGIVLCFDKTTLDKNKHCFAKSDNIIIEIIKLDKSM